MHITLNLTSGCNMYCNYCYALPNERIDMTQEIAFKAINLGLATQPNNLGIIFFGGEPLLKKDLIQESVNYATSVFKKSGFSVHYKITTNGLLLDEDFLEYCSREKLSVALSFDGIEESHNTHRRTKNGECTFTILEDKLHLLLSYQPYANVYLTITPETVKYYYKSVEYLFKKNVKYIVVSLNYAGNWTDDTLKELKKQYVLLSSLYEKMILEQKKFYFSPFETKLSSHIKGEFAACEKCHLGIHQISVSPQGSIYPCVQFVNKDEYKIGDVWNGIDYKKRDELYKFSQSDKSCKDCELNNRCNNGCSCLNYQTTGNVNTVSPIFCETERILSPIADKLGNKLFANKAPMFIQKHYNVAYPLLSLFEDTYL